MADPLSSPGTAPSPERIALGYVYANYRTALLNRLFYGYKLRRYRFWNALLDILVGVGAAGSGVAGLAIWTSSVGQGVLPWLLAVSTILGVAKPILNLGKAIETYAQLCTGHSTIYFDIKALVEDIHIRQRLPPTLGDTYAALQRRAAELGGLHDTNEDTKLVARLTEEVNGRIPVASLWYPSEEPAHAQPPALPAPTAPALAAQHQRPG